MEKRKLGQTGFDVARIGLGTWQLGSDCWGDMNRQKAFGILETAVANGVTFFDTADVYGAGNSESLLEEFFAAHALRPVIATKIGRWARQAGDCKTRTMDFYRIINDPAH